jgi:hypothetical protein
MGDITSRRADDPARVTSRKPLWRLGEWCRRGIAVAAACLLPGQIAWAAEPLPVPHSTEAVGQPNPIGDYFSQWFERVDATSAEQPNWAAPLTTITPLLKEFVMYGQAFQTLPNHTHNTVYSGGMPAVGLHLIPTRYNEIYIGTPAYNERSGRVPVNGLSDWPFFLIKHRIASANAENGDYVVTAFISGQAPIGDRPFTNNAYVVTPTLAVGKGFGDFNIQANVQLPWPTSNYNALGTQLAANVAFQWHLFKYFWPEIELNYTTWINGPRNGLDQLFITFDAIIGPFPIPGTRIKPAIVVGYQRALTPSPAVLNPLTPVYSESWLLGTRFFF